MIRKATVTQLPELSACFNESLLKENYFSDPKYIKEFLLDSINKDELYSYFKNNQAIAFMRIDPVGMFSKFPLLRCLVVNPEFRNMGIGRSLLSYFEELYFENCNRIFLCVSDFNIKAKKLYLESGYMEVGCIPGLYKDDVTEYVLCKTLKA